MAYNANARKQLLEELEKYGPVRDGSGRATAILITRMRKHGYKVASQTSLNQLINRLLKEGKVEVERNKRVTYSIALAKPIQIEMVDDLPAALKPQAEVKAEPQRVYDFDTQRRIAKLERQLEQERIRIQSKDAVIHGLNLRIKQLESNLRAVMQSPVLSDEHFREIQRIMSTPPGFDKYHGNSRKQRTYN